MAAARAAAGEAALARGLAEAPRHDRADAEGFVVAELLRADELITGDRYIFIRSSYLQHRKRFISGGVVDDSFSDFEEGEHYEDF